MPSPTPRPPVKPELMSPAGGWPQLKAAVEAGADAVYFGLDAFHARAKVGFRSEELPDVMRYLHERGVLGFVTFNVLIFDRELPHAEKQLIHLAESGADAIIVQDLGVARLAHDICPDLPIHGSTQMSITSAEGAELARRVGASRVVLGRELSLRDIERIAQATDIELETFVHGALCVSYSGQCFSSEAWGGRSANRGQCAQACRLPYDLIVDGAERDLGDARYLLSPGDLYALHQVPELVRIGVHCLKIEGRYKDSEYTALTTSAYRKAIDDAWAGRALSITKDEERDLEQVYSRGLGASFISGTNHQTVVQGRAPRHRGVRVGEVVQVTPTGVRVKLTQRARLGDGVVFDAAAWRSPEEREEGGHLYGLWRAGEKLDEAEAGSTVEFRFGRGAIDATRVREGDLVWRTHDPTLAGRARKFTQPADPVTTRPVTATFTGAAGQAPTLTLADEQGRAVTVSGDAPLQPARSRALTDDAVRENLAKLGGTPYHLADAAVTLHGDLFLPVSELNALRRRAVQELTALRGRLPERHAAPKLRAALEGVTHHAAEPGEPELHLLVRTPEQLDAALDARPASITLDYLELYGLKPAVQRVRDAGIPVRVASPRVLKPTEQNIQKFLLGLGADILVRSGGLLEGLQHVAEQPTLVGDFSLNAANVLTARELLNLGLARVTPTHDLNASQVTELAGLVGPGKLEVIAYQHLPVFHTEHCVFCRFLSSGTDYTNCGHPCEQHRVALRDEKGLAHPVMADVGCRNTVFGAQAQTAARHLGAWHAAGIRHYRLEFVHESADDVTRVTAAFRAYFQGGLTARAFEEELAQVAEQGVTEGSLFVPSDFEKLPQLDIA